MSSQQVTDLLCLVGRCLLASIDVNRTYSLHRVLVAIQSYIGYDDQDLLTSLENDIEVEKQTPSELTFLLKFFMPETLEDDIRQSLTLECSPYSESRDMTNRVNLESNIKKCIQNIRQQWTLPVVTDLKELKLNGLRSLIKRKEDELKSMIQTKEDELKVLRTQETKLINQVRATAQSLTESISLGEK